MHKIKKILIVLISTYLVFINAFCNFSNAKTEENYKGGYTNFITVSAKKDQTSSKSTSTKKSQTSAKSTSSKKDQTSSGGSTSSGSSTASGRSTSTIDPSDYKPDELSNVETELIFNKTGVILAAIRNISIVTSVIVLMVIGVKYILGSVEEKASYKETMVPYIIGCILATSGIVIVSYIYNAFHS